MLINLCAGLFPLIMGLGYKKKIFCEMPQRSCGLLSIHFGSYFLKTPKRPFFFGSSIGNGSSGRSKSGIGAGSIGGSWLANSSRGAPKVKLGICGIAVCIWSIGLGA